MNLEQFLKNYDLNKEYISREISIIAAEEFICHMDRELRFLPDDPKIKRSFAKNVLLVMTLRLLWTFCGSESKYKEFIKEYIKELDGFLNYAD